jgi:regulator of protease activity HflC (stomatin/prohibitin superfamily)
MFDPILIFVIMFVLLIIVLIILASGIRIVDQYERGVVLTLGRFSGIREPGFNIVIPVFQKMTKVDMRTRTVDIPKQEVITKDNVTVGINAVVYFKVEDSEKAVLNIQDYTSAVAQYAQAALRDVIGGIELDAILSERVRIAGEIKTIVDEATKTWGIDVSDVKVQDIELPQDMKRIMAKQAESERERRAVIIRAEGEFTASEKLAQAAEVLNKVPGGLSLRTLATMEKISNDPAKTIVFAVPVEIMEGIKKVVNRE